MPWLALCRGEPAETLYVCCDKCSCCRYFTVLNIDAAGQFKPIHKGLLIDEANQTDMRALLKAQKRWQFEEEDKNLLSLKPLDISI